MKKADHLPVQQIQNRIFTIRGVQVMIDNDLAELYNVSTSRLNEQVKRNKNRFPEDFMFQLTIKEWENLISQNATSSWGGRRKLPHVFTEQGIASLSGVLKSDIAIEVNIAVMRAFVQMRMLVLNNAALFKRLESIEIKQINTDNKLNQVLKIIEVENIKPKQGIFYNGQIYDAYIFVSDLIRSANKSIVLIDNFIDDTVLTILMKRKKNITATIFIKKISKQLTLDLVKHNAQYPSIEIKEFKDSHDRFIIIDDKTIYHIGASLKDLGKKWFAFSKMEMTALEMLNKLKG